VNGVHARVQDVSTGERLRVRGLAKGRAELDETGGQVETNRILQLDVQ